jgi:uncharacterized damage-inducible protein DinB
MAPMRRGDVLWTMLMDSVRHSGQFSVYLRTVGGKLPSIYGPSADEPCRSSARPSGESPGVRRRR